MRHVAGTAEGSGTNRGTASPEPASPPGDQEAPGGVVDLWVNVVTPAMARRWQGDEAAEGARHLFGDGLDAEHTVGELVEAMDAAGVATAVVSAPLRPPERAREAGALAAEDLLDAADAHPGRLVVSATVDEPRKPLREVARIRELARHPRFSLVRITPFLEQVPIDDRLHYPVYATCAELGLPVSVNVGVPGPRVRSGVQHPERLEPVLIDFPGLVVIGAHMGHPYEALLVTYMMKWDTLHLSNSAYLADYMDDALVRFMGSSRGRGRVLFASDHPVIPMERAVASARKLPLDEDGMDEFLGAAARRLLERAP